MDKKAKSIVVICMVLLLCFTFGPFGSIDVASADSPVTGTEQVTWDFYVRAGANTSSPPMPSPAPQPTGFNFTVAGGGGPSAYCDGPGPVAAGYDFGNITRLDYSPPELRVILERGWAKVNITNLIGEDIVITDLKAEVMNGTETLEFYHGFAGMYMGNHTLVFFDQLDPWHPVSLIDECDYYTGVANPQFEGLVQAGLYYGDTYAMATDITETNTGPASLLEPDYNGDAALTNHTAPVYLAAGDTFTEYFGVQIFGNATGWPSIKGSAKIYGTITLTLTYTRVRSPNSLDVIDVALPAEAYQTWTVDLNVTVKNVGISSINVNVTTYGFNGSAWIKIGTLVVTSLAADTNTTLTFNWNLADTPVGTVPVRAVAVSVYNTTHIYYDELWGQIDIILWGDINDNGVVDLGDIGKVILIYSGIITGPEWMVRRADLNGNGVVDLGDIGKVILIYSGILP